MGGCLATVLRILRYLHPDGRRQKRPCRGWITYDADGFPRQLGGVMLMMYCTLDSAGLGLVWFQVNLY